VSFLFVRRIDYGLGPVQVKPVSFCLLVASDCEKQQDAANDNGEHDNID
jgi:hypothetical protein